jgi:hypothetical protein
MQIFLSWPMHTPANHLDAEGVLPGEVLDEHLRDLLTAVHGSRFAVRGSRFAVRGSRFAVRGSRFAVRG